MNKKILIVDDDSALSEILAMTFSLMGGIDVQRAFSGEEGILKAAEYMPDLIIMDYRMPGMNGWDAAKVIKDNGKTQNIPIIGYTAWAGKDDILRGIGFGINEIVTKPLDIEVWEEKVNKYLVPS